MRVDILTLFPTMFESPFAHGVVGRAIARGLLDVTPLDVRRFATDKHRSVDDYPYGGGPGMVLMPGPLFAAVESLELPAAAPVILMTPQGRPFSQAVAHELAAHARLVFVCGHYEGVDERVRTGLVTDEISIGDYVLGGGEIPTMAIVDAVARLLPGAMDEESGHEESHAAGLLEYPQYTRPATFRDLEVPPILLSGNHQAVARWRREQALRRTVERRPDLLAAAPLTDAERALVERWMAENPVGDGTYLDDRDGVRRRTMELSARNQLKGTVKSVKLGTIMAEVVVDVGGQEVVSAITRGSAESLGLREGEQVTVIIKSTEVMIGK